MADGFLTRGSGIDGIERECNFDQLFWSFYGGHGI